MNDKKKILLLNEKNGFFKIIEIKNLETRSITYTLMVDQEVVSKNLFDKEEAFQYMYYIIDIYKNKKYNTRYLNFKDWKNEFFNIKIKKTKVSKIDYLKIDDLNLNDLILENNGEIVLKNISTGKILLTLKYNSFEIENKNFYKVIFEHRKLLSNGIPAMLEYEDDDLSYFSNDLLDFEIDTNNQNQKKFIFQNEKNEELELSILTK